MKSFKFIPLLLILLISFFTMPCSKNKIKDDKHIKNKNSCKNDPFFSEQFRKTGWINSTRYRAVVHIQTYEQCIKNSPEYVREYLEIRALRCIQNELGTGLSRDAVIQINNLIKKHGIILRPDLQCKEINIYYFDITKKNLQQDFQNIRSLK